MALVPITVNGTCLDAEGNAYATKPVYFYPLAVFGAGDDAIGTQSIMATTDVHGDFTVDLFTDDAANAFVRYGYILPSQDTGTFDLTDDADPASFGDLVALGSVGDATLAAALTALQALIDAHAAVKASTTVLGHVKVDGTSITINGSGVISASGGGGGGGAPSGPAGGVLAGTYPNPSFAADMATQAELDAVAAAKQPLDADLTAIAALSTTSYGRALLTLADLPALKTLLSLVKGDVGLGNVDNTSDTNKPVSTAQAAADALVASDAASALSGHANTLGSPSTFGHVKFDGITIQAASGVMRAQPLTPDVEIQRALGLSIVAETVPKWSLTGQTQLVSGEFWVYPIWMPRGTASTPYSLTGVKFFKFSIGNYVASGLNNKIALYSYSAGTLTRIDSAMTNDTNNLWMQGNDTVDSAAFASAYPATSGLYFIGMLYRNSSQSSAPALRTFSHASAMVTQGFTNSAKWGASIAGQTDLPASIAMSTMSVKTSIPWLALY